MSNWKLYLAGGIVVLLIALGLLVRLAPNSAVPSQWFGLRQDDVNEWLAWIGLAAFIFALVQLGFTASATEAAHRATLAAMSRVELLSASAGIDESALICESAAEAVSRSAFRDAKQSCTRILDNLARVEIYHSRLAATELTLLKAVKELMRNAQGSCVRGIAGELVPQEIVSLEEAFRGQRRDLMRVSSALRSMQNAGAQT